MVVLCTLKTDYHIDYYLFYNNATTQVEILEIISIFLYSNWANLFLIIIFITVFILMKD